MYSWYDMVQTMKAWIGENPEQPPTLTAMAARLGYSPFYVTKKFHEITNMPLREYMARMKLRQAAKALYTTDARILDIAVMYGYASQEAFTRAFARSYGVTPAAYRRLPKPSRYAEKEWGGGTSLIWTGGIDMKISVKQMQDWNYYAFYAEEVEEKYWDFFHDDLWWQVGNSFVRPFDNVQDFPCCAANFAQYGERCIQQKLKMIPAPWEQALRLFITEAKKTGAPWYVHGSTAMALQGIDVAPKDVDIFFPNAHDFDRVRAQLYPLAIYPIERCDNWVASGLGTLFLDAAIGLAFANETPEPLDVTTLDKVDFHGETVYVSTLGMLRKNNEFFGRPDRVKLIEDKMAAR